MGITFIEAKSNNPNETMTVNELIDWLEYYKETYNAGVLKGILSPQMP